MKVCPQCGEENPEKFRLCGFCGTPFMAAEAPQEVRKTVTVVFSDLVGSTSLGESLDSETLREVLGHYFEAMQAVLERHGGAVEKFIGDAIMAVFGLPKLREDDALRAVRAAREMQEELAVLNEKLTAGWGITLANRTGVNTGEVVAGDVTAGQRLVTGDAVNVAARLEQAAGAGEVLMGDLTYRLVREGVEVEPVEPLALKGKADPVPAYRLLSVTTGGRPERRQDAPIVGRERELEILTALFDAARDSSSCHLATVVGAAGVGKSRLVEELSQARGDQATVVRGRCLSHGRGVTFWPVIEMARAAAGIREDDPPDRARAKLSALVGSGREDVAERVASVVGLSSEQFPVEETFWGVRKLLEGLAQTRPLVVVVEDIHWAETTLLDLLEHVLLSAEAPILLVCLARHELEDIRPEWGASARATSLPLEPLSAEDAARVADNLLGDVGLDERVRVRIVEAAEGNPLFVEQMLSMMIDEGLLHRVDGTWRPAGDLSELEVPPTIQALLAARLDLLGPEERGVIEAAAVSGLVFPEDALRELVTEQLAPRVEEILSGLMRKHLVRPDESDTRAGPGYRFDHGVIRDAAYRGMLKRTRATLHERFVAWADRVNRDRDRAAEYEEILGYHLEQAYVNLSELGPLDDHGRELGERAATRLASAGRRAFARGDMAAAANLLRRAVMILPEEAPARLELLPDLGEALMDTGEFAWAEVFLDEAVDAAGDVRGLVGAKARLLRLLVKSQTSDPEKWAGQMVAEAEQALKTFEAASDEAGLASAWRLLAWAHGTTCEYGRAAEASQRAVERARAAGDDRQRRHAAAQYAVAALHGPTPVDEAILYCERIVEELSGDRRSEGIVTSVLSRLRGMRGEFDEARRLYRAARAMLEDLGRTVVAASTSLDSYGVEVLAGDLAAAERELRRDYEALSGMGERYLLSTVSAELARVVYAQGRYDEADLLSGMAQELAAEDDVSSQALWRSSRSTVLARRGENRRAVELAQEALALIDKTDAQIVRAEILEDLAEVFRLADRAAEANAALAEAAESLSAKGSIAGTEHVQARSRSYSG